MKTSKTTHAPLIFWLRHLSAGSAAIAITASLALFLHPMTVWRLHGESPMHFTYADLTGTTEARHRDIEIVSAMTAEQIAAYYRFLALFSVCLAMRKLCLGEEDASCRK